MDFLLNTFVVLFVVVDPLGNAPLFAALTPRCTESERRHLAFKGIALSTAILLIFFATGNALLKALKIEIPAFQVAGGILLFLIAIDMVFARQSGLRGATTSEQAEARERQDISIFPLAFPLIAGPGAITTVLLMASEGGGWQIQLIQVGIILLVLALTLVLLLITTWFLRAFGETGTNVIDRLLGLLLAAIAVQFILDGLRNALNLT